MPRLFLNLLLCEVDGVFHNLFLPIRASTLSLSFLKLGPLNKEEPHFGIMGLKPSVLSLCDHSARRTRGDVPTVQFVISSERQTDRSPVVAFFMQFDYCVLIGRG